MLLKRKAQMAGNTFIWVDDMYRVVKETMRNVLHEVAFPDDVIRKAATIAREDGLVVVQGSKPTDAENRCSACICINTGSMSVTSRISVR